jgi:hypothetical protein
MNSLAKQIVAANLADRIFKDHQLSEILGKSDARRYGLVNRAIKDGALIRLKRGTYLLDTPYRREAIHPFVVAQALVPGSYISFETALAYHGWIPEAVYTTASVTPGRKTITQDTADFGPFIYQPLAIHDYRFLASISRKNFGTLTAFIAEPLRALMDLVTFRKQHWSGLNWLTDGLRIDNAKFLLLKRTDFSALQSVYKHKPTKDFLYALETVIATHKASARAEPSHD